MSEPKAPKIEFPCDYVIKVIGDHAPDFTEFVVAVVEQHAPGICESDISINESRGAVLLGAAENCCYRRASAQGPV